MNWNDVSQSAINALGEGKAVLLFAPYLPHQKVTQRLLCDVSGVDEQRIENGQCQDDDWTKINAAIEFLAAQPLWIDGVSADLTEDRMRSIAAIKAKTDKEVVVISYLMVEP